MPTPFRNLTGDDLLDLRVRRRGEKVRWELLNADLSLAGDLHPIRTPPRIEANTEAAFFRTLHDLTLLPSESADIDPFSARVKPYWVLETGDEYELGVFMFQGQSRPWRTWGSLSVCSMLVDQQWVLDQARRSTYSIKPGDLLTDHLVQLAGEAGIVDVSGIERSPVRASNAIGKLAGTSRFAIMLEICRLLGFLAPYFNNAGKLICRSAPELDQANPDSIYRLGSESRIVKDTTVESDDLWNAPNVFVVVNTSATGAPIVGSYELPSDAPNSKFNRGGFEVVETFNEPGVETSAQAAALAKTYAQQSHSYRWIEYTSTPDPRHDLFGIVEYVDVNYREPAWTLTCVEGGPHSHSLRRIYPAAA